MFTVTIKFYLHEDCICTVAYSTVKRIVFYTFVKEIAWSRLIHFCLTLYYRYLLGESKSFSMKQGTVEKITRYSLFTKATATKMIQSILEGLLNLMLSKMSKS